MPTVHMYGIANCDTIKKARRWLQEHGIDCRFHDYKKEAVDEVALHRWCRAVGWEILLNRRGTTWRKLSDADRADIDEEKAIRLLLANPSMIKRPVLEIGDQVMVGFSEGDYAGALL